MAILIILSDAVKFLVRGFLKLFGFVSLFFLLQYSTVPLGTQFAFIAFLARDHSFDYISWELDAIGIKAKQALYGLQPFLNETERASFVRDFMADLGRAEAMEAQINAIYTHPASGNPDFESASLRASRNRLRADLSERQPLAESILEGQVAAVLVEQGFDLFGQVLPPISMHFTQVPNLLVISPRDAIRFDLGINLDPMSADQEVALEGDIDQQADVSSLIVPLGGIALYPSMILETASIPYALEVVSHEWLHHYLLIFPLGYSYDLAGETRIINETTANLFGKQIGALALARYYPDLVPPAAPAAEVPAQTNPEPATETPPAVPSFDFAAALNETRVEVDRLLADGKIDEAETFMEQQRTMFVEHGYLIRKINQAFFAFYGGYQGTGSGAGGSDPIGPSIEAVRAASPSIVDWIAIMRGITTRAQLVRVRDVLTGLSATR